MGGGDGDRVEVQEPSEEEREAQRLQLQILQRQERESRLLAPFLFEDLGLRPLFEGPEIVGFEELAPEPITAAREEVELGLLERTLAALSGELPVDPALESRLAEAEERLNEQLIRDFGSVAAARSSSAGIARLAEFDEFRENTLAAARRGELSLAEQLSVAEAGVRQAQTTADLASIISVAGRPFGQASTSPGAFASALGQQRLQRAGIEAQGVGGNIDPFAAIIGSVAGPAFGRVGTRFGGAIPLPF